MDFWSPFGLLYHKPPEKNRLFRVVYGRKQKSPPPPYRTVLLILTPAAHLLLWAFGSGYDNNTVLLSVVQ
jgi:hypothetical protein